MTLTDPFVSNLMRGAAGNGDNVLDAGEVWFYTASFTVTQDDIDTGGGGRGAINNTATADTDQSDPVTASTSVAIERRPIMTLEKVAAVPGGTADTAGEVISYTFTVKNDGNMTLTNLVVTDPRVAGGAPILDANAPIVNQNVQLFTPIVDGDYNLGDTNNNGIAEPTDQNGVWDPGETFQFVYPGDTNNDGIHDAGETWQAVNLGDTNNNGIHEAGETWVGDTNQNGVEESGERWQFKNLGDTNQNRLQDAGETWHYVNRGDDNQNGVEDPGETFQYANAGDTNQNGIEDSGETFQYYNVGDTNRNGVEDNGETFQFAVNEVPGVDANNDGFNDGDTNEDGELDVGETWKYAASHTVTQDEIDNRDADGIPTVDPELSRDNTATATVDQASPTTDSASVPIEQRPHLSVTKTASIPDSDNDSKIDSPVDDITYTITVVNDGNMTLTGVSMNDSVVGSLTTHTETGGNAATNGDGELNVGETWTYTATYNTQQSDIDNRGSVDGTADDKIHNTASATTAQAAGGSASADVLIDYRPHLIVTKAASIPDSNNDGKIDSPADDIAYTVTVVNDGNVTLTGVNVNDSVVGPLTTHAETGGTGTNGDNILNVGETWTYTATYNTQQSDIDNRGNIDGTADDKIHNTASATTAQAAGGSASADVLIDYRPHLIVTKAASIPDSDNDGKIDGPADDIAYTVTVVNDGNVTLTGVTLADPLLQGPNGTLNAPTESLSTNGTLDVGETWTYTATYNTQQADIDNRGNVDGTADDKIHNTATVTTGQGAGGSASADVLIDYQPSVMLTKTASVPGGTADANETIEYTIDVSNSGNVTLTNPVVTDTFASNLHGLDLNEDGFNDGDLNHDGKIEVGETWQYRADHVVTPAEAAAGGSINNTASVVTDQGATDSDSASVPVMPPAPVMFLDISGLVGTHWVDSDESGDGTLGDLIQFSIVLHNLSSGTLNNLIVSDLLGDAVVPNFQTNPPANLAPDGSAGDTWTSTYNHALTPDDLIFGHVYDELTVTALDSLNLTHTIMAQWDQLFPI